MEEKTEIKLEDRQFTFSQAAEILGISKNALKMRVARADLDSRHIFKSGTRNLNYLTIEGLRRLDIDEVLDTPEGRNRLVSTPAFRRKKRSDTGKRPIDPEMEQINPDDLPPYRPAEGQNGNRQTDTGYGAGMGSAGPYTGHEPNEIYRQLADADRKHESATIAEQEGFRRYVAMLPADTPTEAFCIISDLCRQTKEQQERIDEQQEQINVLLSLMKRQDETQEKILQALERIEGAPAGNDTRAGFWNRMKKKKGRD